MLYRDVLKILLLLVILSASAVYGEVSVDATVDRNVITIDDMVTLSVTVRGEKLGSVNAPQLPATNNWSLQGTSSSTSTSVQIVNSKISTTKTLTYTYYLAPQDTGTLTIPSIDVRVRGKKYTTKPIDVVVVSGGKLPAAKSPAPKPTATPKKEAFISATATPETVYVGQQVTVDFSIFTRQDIINLSLEKDAEFKNFWVEKMYEANRLRFQPTSIGGVRYYGMLIKRFAAFPLSPGKLKIEPMELTCTIRYPPRGFFDFGRREDVNISSNRLNIFVLPLPLNGQPSDFSGAVGKYTITVSADKCTLKTGDALTYTVSIQGKGNIEALELPDPKIPTDFEIFDRREKVSKKTIDGAWGGTKKFEYILVPHSEGRYIIPPLRFSYFDPKARKYRSATSDSVVINVRSGKGGVSYVTGRQNAVVAVGKDIEFIKPDLSSMKSTTFMPAIGLKSLWFVPLELLLILLVVLYRQRQEHKIEHWRSFRASRALKQAKKRLAAAKKQRKPYQALGTISDAIFGYIADKFAMESGAIIFDEAAIIMSERGIEDETIEEIQKILDSIDAARFAPQKTTIENISKIADKTADLLRKIDQKIG